MKNMVEASVLVPTAALASFAAARGDLEIVRLGDWMRSHLGRQKSENASRALAFEYADRALIIRSADRNQPWAF